MWSEYNYITIDINECSQGTDDCTNTCYNTVGSYKCGCPVGKELDDDGVTCIGKYTVHFLWDIFLGE